MSLRNLRFALPVLVLAVLASSCASFAEAAAIVNGSKIPISMLEEEIDRVRDDPAFAEVVRRQGDAVRGDYRREVLTNLIRLSIMEQEAEGLGVEITEDEIDAFMQDLVAQFGGEAGFQEVLEQANVSIERAREIAVRQLIEREVRAAVAEGVEVPDEEIRQVYEENQAVFQEVHLLRITTESREAAQQALTEIGSGKLFSEVARELSIDENAEAGGDLGWVPVLELDDQLRGVLEAVPEGGTTDPIQTASGFAVYQVLERRPRPLAEVREEIREQLATQAGQGEFNTWLVERLLDAEIVVNPKYGRFDERALQVVPPDDELPG